MKTTLFLLLNIFIFTGVNSQIRESYEPNFTQFSLSDFGFKGKIKTITTSFLHKNDSGKFEPYAWKTIRLIHHFNEAGNVIESYGIGHRSDTIEITFYTYDEKNKILTVKNHSAGFLDESNTNDLRNWELKEARFDWDEAGNNIKIVKDEMFRRITILNDYNSNHQLTKTVRLDNTAETNSSLDKTEYFYNEKGLLIKSICMNENQPHISGETNYSYNGNEMASESFISFDGSRQRSSDFKNGVVEFIEGKDTLAEGYSYSRSIKNEKGEIINSYNHSTNDGEFKNWINYAYLYDANGNLIEFNSIMKDKIIHSKESADSEYYRTKYEIEYY